MITDLFLDFITNVGAWFFSFMPQFDEENGLILDVSNMFGTILGGASALGAWIPWGHILSAVGVVIMFYLGTFFFRIIWALAGRS